jgi:hypothetical protein
MTPTLVRDVLNKHNVQPPKLSALEPDINEYRLLAYQPQGDIRASKLGIGNKPSQDSLFQCAQLLNHAASSSSHLVVSPEYSLPWKVLIDSLCAGRIPSGGCLWALGCESITVAELEGVRTALSSVAVVEYESLDASSDGDFLDPLAYVFSSTRNNGDQCVVVLIQFKTHRSVDSSHVEARMIRGSLIYVFGTQGSTIRLVTFICSDVLALTDQLLKELYHESLILHIQLNPKPREPAYRSYRKQIFTWAKDATELFCLNWAAGIRCKNEDTGTEEGWKNIGGSGWYLKPNKIDLSDTQISANHRNGLYYTWHDPLQCNVLFLNYAPAIYEFASTKVWHHGVPQVQSKQTGPRLLSIKVWDETEAQWKAKAGLDDGFSSLILPWIQELGELNDVYTSCPLATERLLSLVQGEARSCDWHSVRELSSFALEESEEIRRITFAQDTAPYSVQRRKRDIQHFVTAQQVFRGIVDWPPELSDLPAGWKWQWQTDHPHSNLVSKVGKEATVVYCTDNTAEDTLLEIGDALRQCLISHGDPPERLAIIFRQAGKLMLWRHPNSKRFDMPSSAEPSDFTEAQ